MNIMDPHFNYDDQLRRLKRFMAAISSRDGTAEGHILFRIIERRIRQVGLSSQVEISTVLHEAYLRICRETWQGTHIERFPAWFKKVSFEIIQEYSKKEKYKKTLLQQLLQQHKQRLENIVNPASNRVHDIDELLRLLDSLAVEELEILNLRIGHGLSWIDIRERCIRDGKPDVSVESLKHMYVRALNRIRKVSDEARQSGKFGEDGY